MNQQLDIRQTARQAVRAPKPAIPEVVAAEMEISAELHPAVLIISLATYAVMMGVYWLLFYSRVDSAFMVAVSTGFLAAYAGTPLIMLRVGGIRASGNSFGDFLHGRMMTNTGAIRGWEALIQVITIPVALTLATMGIGFAILNTL